MTRPTDNPGADISRKDLARVLRNLERKGLIESRQDADGQTRWFITEKGRRTPPEDVDIPDEWLS